MVVACGHGINAIKSKRFSVFLSQGNLAFLLNFLLNLTLVVASSV